ncbi:L-serine ammonia-lyase [Dacryopinax primogenitus]|uniref:L-serine ammonia-lyase n=1 Tax=Dacryopinax primogenitus (strain DJM 731) TaxID=1858805 RepID=M5G5E4_DACPD|nr:L-serine ammonia-lyase [Dacryopinax primogenitus]EJU03904.1 L-serine ammonia-lyase [Dacryopinax primogenitus]
MLRLLPRIRITRIPRLLTNPHPHHPLPTHSHSHSHSPSHSRSIQLSPSPLTSKALLSTPIDIPSLSPSPSAEEEGEEEEEEEDIRPVHAVISTFDLFSIGVGRASSHTVGPMRAGRIFVAATGKGHMTPQAILLGFEGEDPETIETSTIPSRYSDILATKSLSLAGRHRIRYDQDRDMIWHWDKVLRTHPNGMRFSAFDEDGDLLATNEYFSVGGGFVVNDQTKVDENLYYKGLDKSRVDPSRLSQTHGLGHTRTQEEGTEEEREGEGERPRDRGEESGGRGGQPPFLFSSGDTLLALTKKHNLTIAQLVYDNERHYLSDQEIRAKLARLWQVMDECIRTGVTAVDDTLPGRLQLRRRAPSLYRRLMRGLYPGVAGPEGERQRALRLEAPQDGRERLPKMDLPLTDRRNAAAAGEMRPAGFGRGLVGNFDHPIMPTPSRKTIFPAIDFLSTYAIAVNEVNAAGGRIVTSPTNGASGLIPAVLKWVLEFISEDPEQDIATFLLTAGAIGMLFKRGATISAAEGGCQAEVGVACSMAAAGFAAVMGGSPEIILQAAEIGIEHNLGLTCDPIDGLVQVPCIERNSLGAVKAVTAAQLALASEGVYSVSLDEAIAAMRLTARDMSVKYKETSLSGLATTVRIPVTSPAC